MTTSGPNPWFWAQNHGFGPDVVIFCLMPAKHTTKTQWLQPNTFKLEKRSPNDADDAGPSGQHHQHHWEPVSQIARLQVPPPNSKKWCSGPDRPRRLVFKTARAHDAHFGRSGGPLKCFKNPSVACGFASKTHVSFGEVLRAPWRNGGPMMQGRRHCRPLHGKARTMACGGNPRALPDLRGNKRKFTWPY